MEKPILFANSISYETDICKNLKLNFLSLPILDKIKRIVCSKKVSKK